MAARDPEYGYFVKDIWLVPGDEEMDISSALVTDNHGMTPIGHEVAAIRSQNPRFAAEWHSAQQLNTAERPEQGVAAPSWNPKPYVFIDGHTVKRTEGWYDDSPSWWVPPH